MKIAIVGAIGEGKTKFVNEVLFRALIRPENKNFAFEIQENGQVTAYRSSDAPPVLIATFTDPQQAAKWLGWKP